MDASAADNGGFVYHCRHAHCTGLDRLFFLSRMLESGWLKVDDLTAEEFLSGDPKPSYESALAAANDLAADAGPADIEAVLIKTTVARVNSLQLAAILKAIKAKTGTPVGALRDMLAEIAARDTEQAQDEGLAIARTVLRQFYADGEHLVRAIDKSFWSYTGTHWRRLTDEQVFGKCLAALIHQTAGGGPLSDFLYARRA